MDGSAHRATFRPALLFAVGLLAAATASGAGSDAGILRLLGASGVEGELWSPALRIYNYGPEVLAPRAFVRITWRDSTLYADSAGMDPLPPGRWRVVRMADWQPPLWSPDTEPVFVVTCSLHALGDTNPDNDLRVLEFTMGPQMPCVPWQFWPYNQPPAAARRVKYGGWMVTDVLTGFCIASRGNKLYEILRGYGSAGWWQANPWPRGREARPPDKGATACGDGHGRVYAAKGFRSRGFWRYDIIGDSWQQLSDIPPGPGNDKVKAGTDVAFVWDGDTGWVYLLKGYSGEFLRYNTATDEWQALGLAPRVERRAWRKGSWLVAVEDSFVFAHSGKYGEFWRYSVRGSTWSRVLQSIPNHSRNAGDSRPHGDGGCAVYTMGYVWALKGNKSTALFAYSPVADTWYECMPMDLGHGTKPPGPGTDLAAGDDRLHAWKGNNTNEYWYYLCGIMGPRAAPGSQKPRWEQGETSTRFITLDAAADALNEALREKRRFAVVDACGRVVCDNVRVRDAARALGSLGAGSYFLCIGDGEVAVTRRFTVVR
ncbi:MAG: hypothetical protein R6X13_05470 [bacterium]